MKLPPPINPVESEVAALLLALVPSGQTSAKVTFHTIAEAVCLRYLFGFAPRHVCPPHRNAAFPVLDFAGRWLIADPGCMVGAERVGQSDIVAIRVWQCTPAPPSLQNQLAA